MNAHTPLEDKNIQTTVTKTKQGPRYLPGDLPSWGKPVHAMIRVNHAGEYGAKRIYQGQIDHTEPGETRNLLVHMKEQEEAHLNAFQNMTKERHVRPTALLPLWHALGYLMGRITATMGNHYSMAATSAVEEVIDQHYQEQINHLSDIPNEEALKHIVEKFREEELEHRDTGYEHGAHLAPPPIMAIIRAITKRAIWLSERF